MLGMLLAIVAAGGPMVRAAGLGRALAVVVDHGLTMSAAGVENSTPRYVEAAGELAGMLPRMARPVRWRSRWSIR